MRLISLVGVLAAALLLGACQVRNTARCQLPDYPCDKDRKEVCRIEDPVAMTGTCQAECQKGVPTSCPQDKPVCGDDGTCRTCSADSDCQAYNPALGRCVQSKCVACKVATAATDCTDVNKPACDAPTGTCRACTLHSECADGICVKDDTLKNLPMPLSLGQCVPSSRQVVVSPTTCSTGCTLASKLMNEVSSAKPYVRLSNFKSTTLMININKPTDPMLPNIHIVTDNADVSPAQLTAEPASSVENNTGSSSAIQVNIGADVIIEGLTILRSTNGLVCGTMGAPGNATYKVRLIRSIFTYNTNALITFPGCDLSISDSWFGPHPAFTNPTGNSKALELDSTTFEIVNTVFLKNGDIGKFSGIRIKNTDMKFHPGRIINSTFARNEWPDPGSKALAVHCEYRPGATLTILNSLFLNDTPPSMGNIYVAPDCFLGTSGGGMNIAYNGSDSLIAGTASVGDLRIADVLTEPRTDPGVQTNLRIKQTAAASVRKGVGMYTDAQGAVPVPTKDQDGRARSSTNVTYGAFEAAP